MGADALDMLAAQADALTPAEPPQDAAGPAQDAAQADAGASMGPDLEERNTQALCMFLALLREATTAELLFSPPLTAPALHLSDDKLPRLCGPWARVLAHYGRDLGALDMLAHPVAQALVATGPALWALAVDLKNELRARKARPLTDAETTDEAGAAAA